MPHGEQRQRYEAQEPRKTLHVAHEHECTGGEDGAPEHDASTVHGNAHELGAEQVRHLGCGKGGIGRIRLGHKKREIAQTRDFRAMTFSPRLGLNF